MTGDLHNHSSVHRTCTWAAALMWLKRTPACVLRHPTLKPSASLSSKLPTAPAWQPGHFVSQPTALLHTTRAAAMQPGPADPPGSYPDRVMGCFLGAMACDALGAYVEGWTAHCILREFPHGLTEFQTCRMGRGGYTGACCKARCHKRSAAQLCVELQHMTMRVSAWCPQQQLHSGYQQLSACMWSPLVC